MTQGEFWEAMTAYRREQSADRMHIAELIRGAGVRIWNLLASKPKPKVEDWFPMPWDQKDNTAEDIAAELKTMSQEERAALAQEFIKKLDGRKSDSR